MSDKTREAFEAWAKAADFLIHRDETGEHRGSYYNRSTRWAWVAWEACAAANAEEVKRLCEALVAAGWEAAVRCYCERGMAGWSSYADEYLQQALTSMALPLAGQESSNA